MLKVSIYCNRLIFKYALVIMFRDFIINFDCLSTVLQFCVMSFSVFYEIAISFLFILNLWILVFFASQENERIIKKIHMLPV